MKLIFSKAVSAARAENRPIVALESTIITHGMPFPQNLETAEAVEAVVREAGVEPATIAVLNGALHIGLEADDLKALSTAQDVMKLSRADFAFATAQGKTGSTTVAATMIAAAMAGIKVFATGGVGGAHRGAETSFDVSADLRELSLSDVIVVCAGAKAILDLPKTLEILETNGVPVIAYGVDNFPAFWSRESGLAAPLRLDAPEEIAKHDVARHACGLSGGVLIANPVPEADEIPASEINRFTKQALAEAEAQNIRGKDVTPFLLGRMFELTDGRSLSTNIALVKNNARLAAKIAVSLGNISSKIA